MLLTTSNTLYCLKWARLNQKACPIYKMIPKQPWETCCIKVNTVNISSWAIRNDQSCVWNVAPTVWPLKLSRACTKTILAAHRRDHTNGLRIESSLKSCKSMSVYFSLNYLLAVNRLTTSSTASSYLIITLKIIWSYIYFKCIADDYIARRALQLQTMIFSLLVI